MKTLSLAAISLILLGFSGIEAQKQCTGFKQGSENFVAVKFKETVRAKLKF